jgi:hypothetical protein
MADAKDLCRCFSFGGAFSSATARPRLASGQIQNSGFQAAGCHAQQGSTTGLFDVIAVGGHGQHIHENIRSASHKSQT